MVMPNASANLGKRVISGIVVPVSHFELQKQNIPAIERDLFRAPMMADELNQYDTVVLDPARAGAKVQCEQLSKSNVQTIVMVSCNPITFARDCQILLHAGYVLKQIIPVDQFVYSDHIELVAYLSRKDD